MELLIEKTVYLRNSLKRVYVLKRDSLSEVLVTKSNQETQFKYFIMAKQIVCNRPLQILESLYLLTYVSSVVFMVGYGREWCHFSFKGIRGPKVNN